MENTPAETELLKAFLAGKSAHSLELFDHLIATCSSMAGISLHPTKTMIGITRDKKPAVWVTQLGKQFIHVVLPFPKAYTDNLCFQKIAQVPGQQQYNHHLRLQFKDDLNDEVRHFLELALMA